MAEDGTESANPGTDPVTPGSATQETQQQQPGNEQVVDPAKGSDPFADLDADTRDWLGKRNVKTPLEAAKLAREQASLLGNAIRIPGEKASDEEREAFLNKLGRPPKADEYAFTVPESLPENMPYDGERATTFKNFAHAQGLTQKQAAAIHDWYVENAVNDFSNAAAADDARKAEIAKAETEKLEKRWGPMSGETAKANLAFADRALRETGGEEMVASLKKWGLMTEDGVIQDETIAVAFAKIGTAFFREGDIPPGGTNTEIGNPFEEGPNFNVTKQHMLIKNDRGKALSLITAAGKKPADFGLNN